MTATASPDALEQALVAFAHAPQRVVALDFDGVLAPLVPRPEDSTPVPESVRAIRRLAAQGSTRVGLVSGRAVGDAALQRAAVPGAALIGSHGAERAVVGGDGTITVTDPELNAAQTATLARLRDDAGALVADVPGGWVEIKPTAVVVHTRPVEDDGLATTLEQRAMGELGTREGVRAIAGKRVVELSVAHATKGDAVALLRHGFPDGALPQGTPVMYIGDDVTDEDALATLGDGDLGIKVGDGDSVATFRVPDPTAVAVVLTRLADLLDAR